MDSTLPLNLPSFPVSDELRTALAPLLSTASTSAPNPIWPETISRLAETLQLERSSLAPFIDAWRTLYTVTLYLDHLQDGDPLGDPHLEALPPALQYHLAFSLYIAAQHALAHLDPQVISVSRITRLQRFWSLSIAQLVSGQFLDLTLTLKTSEEGGGSTLEIYEQLATQKTGATFALAFGGAAILATDDETQIAALTNAGAAYGMLLQYHDDLSDSELQEGQPGTMTLSRALLGTHPKLAGQGQRAAVAFLGSIYAAYIPALEAILAPLPAKTRSVYAELLRHSFGEPPKFIKAGLGGAPREET